MFRFEELEIWKMAIEYADKCYNIADKFPKHEIFALGDQLRRAAVSIPNNIAEGSGGTPKEFSNFLNISVRSTLETISILIMAERRVYISAEQRLTLYKEAEILIRRIRAFKNSINN